MKRHFLQIFAPRFLVSFLFVATFFTLSCGMRETAKLSSAAAICSASATDPDSDGWGWEFGRSCRIVPICGPTAVNPDGDAWGWENQAACRFPPQCKSVASDPDRDGWGWENGASCRTFGGPTRSIKFETTFYPFGLETFPTTTCGKGEDYDGYYFAVTEASPLWSGSCDNDSWGDCADADCLSKWDRIPSDAKRIVNGYKKVREPRCDIPCGKEVTVHSENRRYSSKAVIYDACPSQHWNNRFKELTEGSNPCAKGKLHLDLRKPLYLKLNGYQQTSNINVYVDVN